MTTFSKWIGLMALVLSQQLVLSKPPTSFLRHIAHVDGLNTPLELVATGPQGFVWVSSGYGLSRFDGHRLVPARRLFPQHTWGSIRLLTSGPDALWIYDGHELVALDVRSGQRTALPAPREQKVTHLAAGPESITAGTMEGLFRLDRSSGQWTRFGPSEAVTGLLYAGEGDLWVGTNEGLYQFRHPGSEPVRRYESGVSVLCAGGDGRIYAVTKQGVACFGDARVDLFGAPSDNDPLLQLALVNDHLFYASRRSYGYYHLLDQTWVELDKKIGLGMMIGSNDTLWVAAEDGLHVFHEDLEQLARFRLSDAPLPVTAILEDRRHNLWLGTTRGLYRSNLLMLDHELIHPWPMEKNTGHITALCETADRALMVGTKAGLFRWDGQDVQPLAGEFSDPVFTLFSSGEDILAGVPSGAARLKPDGAVIPLPPPENNAIAVYDIAGSPQRPWLATARGLFRLEDENWTPLPDLAGIAIGKLYVDENENLWIACAAGLKYLPAGASSITELFSPHASVVHQELNALTGNADGVWASGKSGLIFVDKRNQIHPFGQVDRTFPASPTAGDAALLSDGRAVFGSSNGLLIARGMRQNAKQAPRLQFAEIYNNGKPFPGGIESLELSSDNRLEISLASSVLHAPEKVNYRYRLEGLDSDWLETDHGEIVYHHLKNGRYQLRAHAYRADSGRGPDAVLKLTVHEGSAWALFWYLLIGSGLVLVGAVAALLWQAKKPVKTVTDPDLSDVLVITTHELRNPLNGMIGMTEALLAELEPGSKQYQALDLIRGSGRRMSRLITRLLDFTRLRDEVTIEATPVRVNEVAEEAIELRRSLIPRQTRLVITSQIPADFPAVKADADRLIQILSNLLDNAVKHTSKGMIGVEARIREDGMAMIRVTDTGSGIPARDLEEIFQPFRQSGELTSRKQEGMGIGLSVVRSLVEAMGGVVWAESMPGTGSTFSFTLPIASTEETRRFLSGSSKMGELSQPDTIGFELFKESIDTGLESTISREKKKGRILVVDDYKLNRQVMVRNLREYGYPCGSASSGERALELLSKQDYDLVILDVMMPGMSGFDVCRRLRETWPMERLPIIFLTARERDEDVVRGFEAGGNDYMIKPISRQELIARVGMHLEMGEIHRLMQKEKELEQVKRLSKESELRLLHSQMKPHFLQNTLNSISYFCLTQPEKAVSTLDSLSLLLRQSFKGGPLSWWTMDEEIKMIDAFVAIQKARHGERLEVVLEVTEPARNLPMPCFLIQPLVENAIFYGLKQTIDGVEIVMKASGDDQHLEVEVINPGMPLPKPFEEIMDPQHALGNIQKRLAVLFDAQLNHRYEQGRHHISFMICPKRSPDTGLNPQILDPS